MTPGFGKPREQLPWLYYPESNRVIINAHNFETVFDPSVNSKTPVVVWCPSRDDTGNGTTTLNDLVGSKDATLTNMDAATDWIANTNAGGIRVLDFDGSNDFCDCGESSVDQFATANDFSVSCWFLARSTTGERGLVTRVNSSDSGWALTISSGFVRFPRWNVGPQYAISTDTIYHVVAVNRSGTREIWVNGVLRASSTSGGIQASSIKTVLGRYYGNLAGFNLNGWLDDVRIFNQAIVEADVLHLYASGEGRGISA